LGASLDAGRALTFSDAEIKIAIEELKRSTDAVSKQTETLRHQQDALAKLINNESRSQQERAALHLKHSQTLELDRKSLKSSVAELCRDIELQLSELDSHGSGALDSTQQAVSSLLAVDDKLLSSLQKLGWELETEDPQEKEDVRKLQDICARLIKHSVEACRTRLDRIYLESLEAASSANGHRAVQGEDISTVQDELESLYSEILPVAQMSVEQQYLTPALKSLSSRNGKSFDKTARAIDYVSCSACNTLDCGLTMLRYVIVWIICWRRRRPSAPDWRASMLTRQRCHSLRPLRAQS
jgi:hypothetical protein